MVKTSLSLTFIFFLGFPSFAQKIGIGLYHTGTETGIGIRCSKGTRLAVDIRIMRANVFSDTAKSSSFVTELSLICRVVKLEKVRFHVDLGYKGAWNLVENNKHGMIVPVGLEAFPFPFQNSGLFFGATPFYVIEPIAQKEKAGIRTAAGFVFYFPMKTKQVKTDS
jgi:hypothetical protein